MPNNAPVKINFFCGKLVKLSARDAFLQPPAPAQMTGFQTQLASAKETRGATGGAAGAERQRRGAAANGACGAAVYV